MMTMLQLHLAHQPLQQPQTKQFIFLDLLNWKLYLISFQFFFSFIYFSNSNELTSLNTFGNIGLIDTPSAGAVRDGELSLSTTKIGPFFRNTISFQALPWANASFRYSGIGDAEESFIESGYTTWDRSFDLRLDVSNEKSLIPSISVGFNDIIGTGLNSSEYLVSSKHLVNNLKASLGLGWGRMGSQNIVFKSGERDTDTGGKNGGLLKTEQLFKGNVGLFGGIEYKVPNSNFLLKAEVSSDSYSSDRDFLKKLPTSKLNYGANYKIADQLNLSAYFLNGNEIGGQVSIKLNPNMHFSGDYLEKYPEPFYSSPIPEHQLDSGFWKNTIDVLEEYELITIGFKEEKNIAVLLLENNHYSSEAQSIGRALRVMSRFVPLKYSYFKVILCVKSIPVSEILLERNQVAEIVDAPNSEFITYKISKIKSAKQEIEEVNLNKFKKRKLAFSLSPYYRLHLFDPNKPLYYDLGFELNSIYKIKPGFVVQSNIQTSVFSTFDQINRGVKGRLPKVRTALKNYLNQKESRIENMVFDSFYKLSPNFYGRFTVGYLEMMYGGLSSELLFFDTNSRFSYGAEINYVRARDFRQLLEFRKVEGLAKINGHVSGYWDTGYKNYLVQVDAGKYLADDIGSTFKLTRNFPNGWKVGGYFTLTDASFDDFGEGSFDKGFFINIPIHSLMPYETKSSFYENIKPIQGDGGARVNVPNRLYDILLPYSKDSLNSSWARIWR